MLKKSAMTLLTIVVLVSLSIIPASADVNGPIKPLNPAAPPAEDGLMVDETPQLWFVELSNPPTADGTSLKTVKADKDAFRANAKKAGLVYTERFAYNTLFNGFSISIKPSQLSRLSRISGVKNIYPVGVIPMPQDTATLDPNLATAITMTGADVVQSELGYTGEGVKVAVMDTGIDVNHPDLGGNGVAELNSSYFYQNPRIKYGYDFVGDAYNADDTSPSYNPELTPDPIPDDCAGHGSHVAGIIGANGEVTGVAPGVTFGSYRVFGCEGSTTDDVMIAAMERALADGMQVLNMSIGSAFEWPQSPTAMASTRLVNKGVVVVASIGNSGTSGLYAAGAPGLGDKVIGVASYDNIMVTQSAFVITPDGRKVGFNPAAGAPPAPIEGTLDIAAPEPVTACPTLVSGHYVSPFAPGSLTGKAALVNRGTCSFYWKALFAEQAGASAVIIANNTSGQLTPTVDPAGGASFTPIPCPNADFPTCPAITVPTVMILKTDGAFIRTELATGPVSLTWGTETVSAANPTGGLISSFSSYGLSPDLTLKPDIGAPGGSIWSTYPLELGGYASLSGTSMSSPHVAGAVALLLQAKPKTSPQAVRDILQNSAVPADWWGWPGGGYLDNVNRQGAGMLRIDKAILATTKITPGKISTGESQAGPFTQVLKMENTAGSPVTYDLSFVNALTVEGVTSVVDFWGSDAYVDFSASSVTVPAGGSASVTATIYPATGPDQSQYGGYIVFTPQDAGQSYRVPFAGFVGDYQSIQALTPTEYGFPWVAVLYEGNLYHLTDPTDWTYSMQDGDVPYFLVHFNHQARTLRIEIYSQNGKDWHRAYNEDYLPRNSTATGFWALPFDGTTFSGGKMYAVPDGTYYAVISVLKANGDASVASDWENWSSPLFVIDRP